MAAGAEQQVQEILRVGIVGNPAQRKHLILAVVHILQESGPFGLLHINFNAQLLPPLFQHHFQIGRHLRPETPRNAQGNARKIPGGQRIRVLGFLYQLTGQVGVVRVAPQVFVVRRKARRNDAARRRNAPVQHILGNARQVNGIVHRLTHFHIVKRRLLHIEAHIEHIKVMRRTMQFRVQRIVGIQQARQVVKTHAGQMNFIVLVHNHRRAAAQYHLHALYVRRPQMILVVAFQYQQLAHIIPPQLEWAGAVGLLQPVPGFVHLLRVQHIGGGVRKLGQEKGFGGVNGELNSAVVNNAHAADFAGRPLQLGVDADDVAEVVLRVGGQSIRVGGALNRPFHVVGGNRLAVVELGVLAQDESVHGAVGVDSAALCQIQRRLIVQAQRNQPAKDFAGYDAGSNIANLMRIQRSRVGKEAHQSAALRRPVIKSQFGGWGAALAAGRR